MDVEAHIALQGDRIGAVHCDTPPVGTAREKSAATETESGP